MRTLVVPVARESSCGGSFPTPAGTGFSGFTIPRASCHCACGSPTGGACDPTIGVELYDSGCNATTSQGACFSPDANFSTCTLQDDTLSAGTDNFLDHDRFGIRLLAAPPSVAQAPSCEVIAPPDLAPPTPGDSIQLCAPLSLSADDTCNSGFSRLPDVLNPFLPGYCISTDGEVECPGEGYSERSVLFGALEDTRACSRCSCGAARDVHCPGELQVVASYAAGGVVVDPAETVAADGSCTARITPNATPVASVNYSVSYTAASPAASGCEAAGGELSGEVDPVGARTVCCTIP